MARMLAAVPAPMVIEPVTLDGQFVRLEPLTMAHHAALCDALLDGDIWRWLPSRCTTPDELRRFIELALSRQAKGDALPFVTLHKAENRIVGTSRFLSIETGYHRVEIGATLVGAAWQRTVVNTEAKYLMLRHAFETWGCLRVEFKTDVLNTKSRAALERLGATQEGIFRNHAICQDGRVRDSVFYSITDEDWTTVKPALEAKMGYTAPNQD